MNARTPATGVPLECSARGLPPGATSDPATRTFARTPDGRLAGAYGEAGQVSGPIVRQLGNALRQAGRHLADGRPTPAARADLTTQIQAVVASVHRGQGEHR